jgi:hypothetical protein
MLLVLLQLLLCIQFPTATAFLRLSTLLLLLIFLNACHLLTADLATAAELLCFLRDAVETREAPVMEVALDCIQKLISFKLVQGPVHHINHRHALHCISCCLCTCFWSCYVVNGCH